MTNASKTMEDFVYGKKNIKNAFFIWTLKNAHQEFSSKSCESLSKLFQILFLNSAIAKNFAFSKDKCSY